MQIAIIIVTISLYFSCALFHYLKLHYGCLMAERSSISFAPPDAVSTILDAE